MPKSKTNLPAVTSAAQQASLISSSLTNLRTSTARVVAKQAGNGATRSMQVVSTDAGIQAVFRHGKTIIQVENDSFAVTTHD